MYDHRIKKLPIDLSQMTATIQDLNQTLKTLLERLRQTIRDETGWTDFYQTYWKLIYSVAQKQGLSHEDAQDVVQETVIKVSRYIKNFEYDPYRGRFRSWLCLITKQQVANFYRKRKNQPPLADLAPADEDFPEFELPDEMNTWQKIWDQEFTEHCRELALQAVKQDVSPEQYQLFYDRCIRERSVEQICSLLGMTRNKVDLAKHRVGKVYKEKLEEIKAKYQSE